MLTWQTSYWVLGSEVTLDGLVCRKVECRSWAVSSERHRRATVYGANSAFPVQLLDNIETSIVSGLLSRCQVLLALDLKKHLYALEGCGYERLWDSAEEAGSRDLCDAELAIFDFRERRDELLSEVVAPE
jgi:hypothetical protein